MRSLCADLRLYLRQLIQVRILSIKKLSVSHGSGAETAVKILPLHQQVAQGGQIGVSKCSNTLEHNHDMIAMLHSCTGVPIGP